MVIEKLTDGEIRVIGKFCPEASGLEIGKLP
jgi:hypothetical protein